MSIFKRIFGKENPEPVKPEVKKQEPAKSVQKRKVYPILKPGDWVGLRVGSLNWVMFGSDEDPKLVVAYGYDTPENFVFLMPRDLEGTSLKDVSSSAYQNLEEFPSDFEKIATLDGQVLTASGGDYSSEKILCKSHLMKAHELLESEELLISIPRRTVMYVTFRDADQDVLDEFMKIHYHTWNDDSYGNARIMNSLFVVKDGEIKGLIPMSN